MYLCFMLEEANQRISEFTANLGRAGLHYIFPNEFEHYAIAFEVLKANGKSVAYLNFPIMPDNMNIGISNAITVSNSSAGVETIINPSFIPFDFTATGTFGRSLRVVAQGESFLSGGNFGLRLAKEFFSSKIKAIKDIVGGGTAKFSDTVKTGYGLCKVLEAMFALGSMVDESGSPYIMVMYNLSFNHSYIVEPLTISFSQDVGQNNAFWRYQLAVKATAPTSVLTQLAPKAGGFRKVIKQNIVTNGINTLGNIFRKYTPTFLKFS